MIINILFSVISVVERSCLRVDDVILFKSYMKVNDRIPSTLLVDTFLGMSHGTDEVDPALSSVSPIASVKIVEARYRENPFQ